MTIPDELIPRLRRRYDDCYACGMSNPIGLKLDNFRRDNGEALADFRPVPDHRGTAGSLHGGVIATVLDEIMVWAAILFEDTLAVTATMELRYRRPPGLSERLVVAGRVVSRSGSRLRLAGEMRRHDEVLVESSGLYVASDHVNTLLENSLDGNQSE